MEIFVENIKCGGCINTITKAVLSIEETNNVVIDLEAEKISVDAPEEVRSKIVEKLHSLGYPEVGHNDLIEKAKSYVSCALGKMSI